MVSGISGSISVDGLISGLDTTNIIDQLVSIQTRRISIFQDRQLIENEKISVFQQLQGLFLGVRTAAGALKSPSLYTNRSVTASNSDILSVTATSDAAACLGLSDVGTLEEGKWADFAVFDEDPQADIANTKTLSAVYVAGNLVPEASPM